MARWKDIAASAIVVALMIPFLSDFLDWLNRQPAGTQSIVGILVVIALGLLGKLLTWSGALAWRLMARGAVKWLESRAPIPAPRTRIGLYDHVINASDAFNRTPSSMQNVIDQQGRITAKLARHAEIVGGQTDFRKRHHALGAFVRDVKPDIATFGKSARRLSDDTALIVSSYRSVFTKVQVNTHADRMYLLQQRDGFRQLGGAATIAVGGLGKMHKSMSGLIDLAPELGQKYETSIVLLLESLQALEMFGTTEVPKIANRRAGLWARIWHAVTRSGRLSASHREVPS